MEAAGVSCEPDVVLQDTDLDRPTAKPGKDSRVDVARRGRTEG